jgi:hypothetical protein
MSTKITNFTELAAASVAAADVLPIIDVSATTAGSKKIKAAAFAQAAHILGYFADTGGDDAYVVDTGLDLSALTAGMVFAVKATTANTGAATLAVDDVTAKTIVKHGAVALDSGDIAAGMIFVVQYDGTNFQLINPKVTNDTIPTYVDIPIPFTVGGSFGSQATNYCGIGNTLAAAEANVPYNPIGITGTIVGLYVQQKTNTHNADHVITMQSGAADASSLTPSDFVITLGAGVLNGSKTDVTLAVTPTMLVGFKFYSASGSGSSTSIGLTIVVRVTLA